MAMKKPFFNRLGGKSRMLKYILPLIDNDYGTYVEPFAGAAWVYFNFFRAQNYILNDIDKEVYKMYLALKEGNFKKLLSFDWKKSKKTFYSLKSLYKNKEILLKRDKYEILYMYRYLNYYGVLGEGETYNESVPKKETPPLERYIECNKKLKNNTKIFNKDYKEVISRFDNINTLMYLDPPYSNNPNNDRYAKNEICIFKFIENILSLKSTLLVSLSSRDISSEVLEILKKSKFKIFEIPVKYSSDNLQKYKSEKKVKKRFEYLFFRETKNISIN